MFRDRSSRSTLFLFVIGFAACGDSPMVPSPPDTGSWTSVRASEGSTCGIQSDGTAYCWGSVLPGAVVPTAVPGTESWIEMVPSARFACGITQQSLTQCFGELGALLVGNSGVEKVDPDPGLVHLVAVDRHICGLDLAGAGFCWGWNIWGQLGVDPNQTERQGPTEVLGGHRFAGLSLAPGASCALDTEGTALCWGAEPSPGSGFGSVPTALEVAPKELDDFVIGGKFGSYYFCAIRSGDLMCWGYNEHGNLGIGPKPTDRNLFLVENPTPVAMPPGLEVTDVAVGLSHTCALTSSGDAYCWGSNNNGELGNGTLDPSGVPVLVVGGYEFVELDAGARHTCGRTKLSRIYCWGENLSGQLGDPETAATTRYSSIPVQVAEPG